MDKELFRETENKVCRYFEKDKLVNTLNKKISILDRQIESINNDLRTNNVSIEPESSSPSFEAKVQTSPTGTSYAEREKVLEQLDQIELDYNFIKDAIEPIEGLCKELLELKYKKGLGEQDIGNKLHLTQPQINKKKWRLIKKIADWDQWNKIS